MKRRAAVYTLGCRLNSAESALIVDRLIALDCDIVEINQNPDIIVINSCTITAQASKKSRQIAIKLRKDYPNAKIVFTGCAVELDSFKLPEDCVDIVVGNGAKNKLKELIDNDVSYNMPNIEEMPKVFEENAFGKFPFKSRSFIKIQEGCNNFCSYCIVPYVRGRERSRKFDELIADCKNSIDRGFPEIVLSGVNVCTYNDNGKSLIDIVREIDALNGNFRIRLSSTEPQKGIEELIKTMAKSEKICRFLHLSLQNGSDRILKLMNRRYVRSQYADYVYQAREQIKNIHIGSDIIVGFPGETEKDFLDSCEFIEKMQFANTHIFSYSSRPGTAAAKMPNHVPAKEIKRRYNYLKEITSVAAENFAKSQIGTFASVIFEESCSNYMVKGWSDNYLQVKVPENSVKLNEIVNIKIEEKNLEINL